MTLSDLQQLHFRTLASAFGVSTATAAFRNDRAARAIGSLSEEHS